MNGFPFFPPQASTVASQVDLLLVVLLVLSGFFSTIILGLIIYFSSKYRRGSKVDRSNPPTSSLKIELAWVFGLLGLGMGTFVWAAIMYLNIFTPPANGLEIYVVGKQWMWKFQHPEGPREIDELHVPRGQKVKLIMTSQDVIHSFYVPAFRIKHDVLPDRYTILWFEATQVGEFPIECAEYCGTQHSRMLGRVIVMEPHDYQDWLSRGGAGTGTTGDGGEAGGGLPLAQTGGQLFQQLGCNGCHDESGTRAPVLTGVFGQQVELEGGDTVTADESYLRESILLPQKHIVAGYQPIMPTYEGQITEEQLNELIAYIKSLGGSGNGNGSTDGGGATDSGTAPAVTPERTQTNP